MNPNTQPQPGDPKTQPNRANGDPSKSGGYYGERPRQDKPDNNPDKYASPREDKDNERKDAPGKKQGM